MQKSTLEDLTRSVTDKEDRMKNWEEEKLVLTSQVKAVSNIPLLFCLSYSVHQSLLV